MPHHGKAKSLNLVLQYRRFPLLFILAGIFLFAFTVFLLGYQAQQQSLTAIQKAIPPRVDTKPISNLLPPEEDDEVEAPPSVPSPPPSKITSGPLAGWRPRKGVHGEDFGLRGTNPIIPSGVSKEKLGKPWAYVQVVNTPENVCSAIMILARMYDFGSVGARVLLYPREWDNDWSLGLSRGIFEEQQKLKLERTKRKLTSAKGKQGAAAPAWVKGEYRPPQDQERIFWKTWPGEKKATRWEKTARRILLSAMTRYSIQLIPIDPLPISAFSSPSSSDGIKDSNRGLRPQVHLPASGSLAATSYAKSRTAPKALNALAGVLTPLHLFNLTQFSRLIYLSPSGLPMKKLDELVTKLPPQTKIATPRKYWDRNRVGIGVGGGFSSHFFVLKPSRTLFKELVQTIQFTPAFESWLGTVTPRTTSTELHETAIKKGGEHGLGLAHSLVAELLESVFGSSALLLPSHPWHVPVHEDTHPTPAAGHRHGSLLGPTTRWDAGKVTGETHYALFTTSRKPWEVWGGSGHVETDDDHNYEMVQMGEWEKNWHRVYASVRRDVCLLDLTWRGS